MAALPPDRPRLYSRPEVAVFLNSETQVEVVRGAILPACQGGGFYRKELNVRKLVALSLLVPLTLTRSAARSSRARPRSGRSHPTASRTRSTSAPGSSGRTDKP